MQISNIIKQKSYEKVIFVLHRHPLTFLPTLALFFVLLIIPVAVYYLIINSFPDILTTNYYALLILLASIYYLSTTLFFYVHFIDYYLDMWIVTNDRIVDIEQHGLFNRVITELDLFRIQDVTTNVQGFFATIFRYGDVIVKTASNNTNIIFYKVANPNHIREQLIHLAEQDRKYHSGQS